MGRKNKTVLFLLMGFALLLAACSPLPDEVVTVTPSPVEAAPSPIPAPAETAPPAWTGQAVDFTGIWKRTDTYIAYPSTIEITNQTEAGFDFSVEAYYQSHMGMTGGTAYFTSENTAFWRNNDPYDDIATGCLLFRMEDGHLEMDEQGQLPFGMNVSAYGTYTTGEPVYYTNGVLETLGPERIALLREAAGEDYDVYVGPPLGYGYFEFSDIQENGYSGLFLEGFWPTFGYDQKIYIGDDGAVWINLYSGQRFTNRPGEEIPGFLLYPEHEEGSE